MLKTVSAHRNTQATSVRYVLQDTRGPRPLVGRTTRAWHVSVIITQTFVTLRVACALTANTTQQVMCLNAVPPGAGKVNRDKILT